MYRALHTPESHPIAALNNYLHRPRRAQREQIVRIPSAPDVKLQRRKGPMSIEATSEGFPTPRCAGM